MSGEPDIGSELDWRKNKKAIVVESNHDCTMSIGIAGLHGRAVADTLLCLNRPDVRGDFD